MHHQTVSASPVQAFDFGIDLMVIITRKQDILTWYVCATQVNFWFLYAALYIIWLFDVSLHARKRKA